MGFWLISLLMFVVMMVVLEVLPDTIPMVDEAWLGFTWLPSTLMLILVLFATFGLQFLKIFRGTWLSWVARLGVATVTILMMLVALLHVTLVHKKHINDIPKQTLQVTATVFIPEISDSVYDEIGGTSYRQKAYLTNIKPVLHHHASVNNPLYDPSRLASHAISQVNYPTELTVLLNARPNKNQSFHTLKALTPNTTVVMTLEISPLVKHEGVGFDGYRWLMGRHIHANAKILSIDETSLNAGQDFSVQGLRQEFREHFLKDWHNKSYERQQSDAVTLSLLTGDRALIDKRTKDLYQFAGISHLLAISGTHVLFLALMLAGLATWLVEKYALGLYKRLPRWQLRFIIMSLTALLYAVFTGFDVPAVRTVYLVAAMGIARYLLLGASGFKMLVVVGLVMAWLDPYVLWQAGFWLSFVAVALLMRYEITQTSQDIKGKVVALIKLQAWLFVAMLPISILIFGKVSVMGFISNLFAVGLFGWVVVPINMLAGLLYVVMPSVADWLWAMVSWVLLVTHSSFELLRLISGTAWLRVPMNIGIVVLMFLAMLPWLMPKIMPRYLSLPVVFLCTVAVGFAKSYDLPSYLELPNSQNVSAVLVKDDDSAWLMINSRQNRMNQNVLADELILALHKKGVRSLTGVIVQTPDEGLARTVGLMTQSMNIGQYWQAGQIDSRQGNLIPSDCTAGRIWQNDTLSIEVMTGWSTLPNDTVHDCSIKVLHTEGLFGDSGLVKTLMVDAHRHDRLWRLWQMLCRQDAVYAVDLWIGDVPAVFESMNHDDNFDVKPVIDIAKQAER